MKLDSSAAQTFPTVHAELDLSAGKAHRAGGRADVDAGVSVRGAGDVKMAIRVGLKRPSGPGWRLASLRREH